MIDLRSRGLPGPIFFETKKSLPESNSNLRMTSISNLASFVMWIDVAHDDDVDDVKGDEDDDDDDENGGDLLWVPTELGDVA